MLENICLNSEQNRDAVMRQFDLGWVYALFLYIFRDYSINYCIIKKITRYINANRN